MTRLGLGAVAATAVTFVASGSTGASSSGHPTAADVLLIRPGQGIGEISLGMAPAQVRAAIGKPASVSRRHTGFGLQSLEWHYDPKYSVRFRTRGGRLRVDRIVSTYFRARTVRGVGVGSLERRLRHAYPSIRCEPLRTQAVGRHRIFVNERTCTLLDRPPHRTAFTSAIPQRYPWDIFQPRDWDPRAVVFEVTLS